LPLNDSAWRANTAATAKQKDKKVLFIVKY